MKWPWVRTRSGFERVPTTSAWATLTAALEQSHALNERVLDALADERGRNQDMAACVIDTLREALGMGEPVVAAASPPNDRQEMPKEIEEAIQTTFPDDAVIQAANLKYAYSQEPRWGSYAKEIADEIRQGA